MSLSKRLSTAVPNRANTGCVTCQWLQRLKPADVAAWNDWIARKLSVLQLWEIAASDPDNPLEVSVSAMRGHIRNHHKASQ